MSGAQRVTQRVSRALSAAVITCMVAMPIGAQSTVAALDERIGAVREGTVRLEFPARAGVCGDGHNWFRTRQGETVGRWDSEQYVTATCETGPVRVVIERRNDVTTDVKTYVGGKWSAAPDGATPLTVSAQVAIGSLLNIVEHDASGPAAHAILALTIADGMQSWDRLFRVARDVSRPSEVRQQAVFWLGDAAGAVATQSLESIAYEPGDREVREQAIFAMSRRPGDEAVTSLLRMAQSLPDRELRKTAIFWLSRTKDPRAMAWLERTLTGR
jgi:hypothetical protein